MTDQSWRDQAECLREGDTIFFPEDLPEGSTREMAEQAALRICTECPVHDECLIDALRTERTPEDVWGVRGGTTPEARKQLVGEVWNAWLGAPCRRCGRTLVADNVEPERRKRYAHHNAHGYCSACARKNRDDAAHLNTITTQPRRIA